MTTAGVALSLVAAGALGWRLAARRWHLPCPTWLAWLVESSYMGMVAGAATLLDRAAIGPGMRVLDAGCGPGRLTLPAAERVGPGGEVVALDLQAAMLVTVRARVAERGLANVRTVLGPLERGIQPIGAFDCALLVAVLGEVPHRERALRALHASLRPGGVLSVTEVVPDPHYQTRGTVRRLAKAAGFRHDRTYWSPLAFTMNFSKPSR